MASPFAVFRRNQKVMLTVVGIAAMVAFVFLDPVMRYVGGNRKIENPVVVETKFGAIKDSELANLRQSRELVEAFLKQVSAETIETQIRAAQLDPRLRDRAIAQWFGSWQQELMTRSKPGAEAAAIETLVLSKQAEKQGMVVSDRAINDFLKQISADSLTKDMLQEVVNHLQSGRRVSVGRLFEALRVELMAAKFSQMFAQSLRDIPPAQKFEYYLRLNRQAKAEIMPLAVADFVSQVADPSPEVLQAFFDAHKDRFPDPASPEPGFKQPKRAAFQYFKVDFAKAQDEFKPQVTDAEIAEYYEKNKAQFRVLDLPAENKDEPQDPDAMPDESQSEGPRSEGPKSDEAAPSDGEKPAEGAKPADEAAPEQPKADEKPTREKQPDAAPQSARTPRARIRLVAAGADEQATEPAAEKPAVTAPDLPSDQPEEKAADDKAADDKATEEKPGDSSADKPEDKDEKADVAAEKPPEPKYEPLEKVTDTIRDTIASQKAGKKIGEIFDGLSAEMRRYADDYDVYNARKQTDPSAKEPKPFPFADLAKAKGIEAKDLPLVTAAEAAQEDLGKVYREDRRGQFGPRMEPFDQFAFSDSLLTLRPMALQDVDGNAYLFWKTAEKAAYVPKLDDVKDTVVRAWKMIEARKLAHKRAEEYAAQARDAKKSLKEVFGEQANLKVIETSPFSWMTLGNVPSDPFSSQPRMSQVEGVENVGVSFMEAVFGLEPGEVGVATNHPEDTAYVVRLAEYLQPLDDLRKDFANEHQMRYMAVAGPDQRRIYLNWLDDLEKEAGVHWLRPADTGRRGRAEPEPISEEGDL